MSKVVRLENNEDVWDMEVSDELAAKIEATNTEDLFRDAPELFRALWKMPQLPFDEDRGYDFSFWMY